MRSVRLLFVASILIPPGTIPRCSRAADLSRVLPPGQKLDDPRLGRQRTLNHKYHPWSPAANMAEWARESQTIRERVLVSNGLWPMLPKQPLAPVIHGKIDRGDYTVEKVFFASLPGHYVSGNLYRPSKKHGRVPGVLCPHGHWKDGRFYDAGEKEAAEQIRSGAERTMAGARFPLQARMVELARLGCVVFHYDMVGVADSRPIGHGEGFRDSEADLRLQSACGLQTFNSIRALDFLSSLPDVDPMRIGVTGASGGGTQTFLLCAVDPRPTVAFPAVMVSTSMQGGCVCENADLMRIGINNVAIAALFAPKPMAMTGAHDWTIDIETKGLPELKRVYALYGKADDVDAKAFPQFNHNYNCVSREMMYSWFNQHLHLDHATPIIEQDFVPIPPQELSVFDDGHPRPSDAKSAPELRKYLTQVAERQYEEIIPKKPADVARYREVVETAARVMLDPVPLDPALVRTTMQTRQEIEPGLLLEKGLFNRADDGSLIPYALLTPHNFNGMYVIWLDTNGKSSLLSERRRPNSAVRKMLEAGEAVVSIDLLLTGESAPSGQPIESMPVDHKYAGYTFCYNRPLVANRVRDVLTAIAAAIGRENFRKLKLVGMGDAGPVALLAAGFARQRLTEVDADAARFDYIPTMPAKKPLFLPGALKYGGLGGLAALAAPVKLTIWHAGGLSASGREAVGSLYRQSKGELEFPVQIGPFYSDSGK